MEESSSWLSRIGSLSSYMTEDQVGEGTYGYVYRAVDKKTQKHVALKRLIIHKDYLGFPLCAVRELKFLKSLQGHENIVKLLDVAVSKSVTHLEKAVKTDKDAPSHAGVDGKAIDKSEREKERDRDQEQSSRVLQRCASLYLVFEYIEHDLGGLIDAKYKFNARAVKCIMKQLFDVLEFLESKKILHRDIKCSNILISNRHQVKLADFGLARSTTPASGAKEGQMDLTNNVVTMWYKAPELLLGATRYSYAVDMWSAGCVLAELELGRPLFPGKTEPEQLDLICKSIGSFGEEAWPELSTLPHFESVYKAVPRYVYSLKSFTSNGQRISEASLNLLDRILVANPVNRASARVALTNKYFIIQPTAPADPCELEPLAVATGESLHEYQTKQKRRAREKQEDEQRKASNVEREAGGKGNKPSSSTTATAAFNPFNSRVDE